MGIDEVIEKSPEEQQNWPLISEDQERLKPTQVFLVKQVAEEEGGVHRRVRLSLPFSRFSLLS